MKVSIRIPVPAGNVQFVIVPMELMKSRSGSSALTRTWMECPCGASGVPGGSLLLIPLACSLFGIGNDIAMQCVAIGLIIGVIQDSCETALNSSSDVLFTAVADYAQKIKRGITVFPGKNATYEEPPVVGAFAGEPAAGVAVEGAVANVDAVEPTQGR